ncbi:hypothetical protein [Streptomyces nitrosporeus]|uniref:hypothetical protein n=1 Tax=Streptomyces nitrosporeus TaxID=28894 RepID=UPI00332ED681
MSSTLTWRTATTLVLNDELIPDPNAGHILLKRLQNVRVAVEGGFLHIDPRRPQDVEGAPGAEFEVHVIPASAVRSLAYREAKRAGRLASF